MINEIMSLFINFSCKI